MGRRICHLHLFVLLIAWSLAAEIFGAEAGDDGIINGIATKLENKMEYNKEMQREMAESWKMNHGRPDPKAGIKPHKSIFKNGIL